MLISDVKSNLAAELHGGTLNRVRSIEMLFERSANTLLLRADPPDTIRVAALSNTVHDDVYNYSLPSDFKSLVDLFPQDEREGADIAGRRYAQRFDLTKAIKQKTVSIEGSEGNRVLRINWRSRKGVTLHTMNSLTANGTWSSVSGASNLSADTITKVSGSASIRFDLDSSGGGIQNTAMSAVNLTDHDEIADVFVWVYFPAISALTSLTAIWGNDLTANFWTSVAQTAQFDASAFKIGWNLVRFPWSTAAETGTVAPATVDSFRLTVASTGAIANVRVDNIIFSIGRAFDIKYYSRFLFQNAAGTFISRPTDDNDTVVLDSSAIQLFHLENLIAAAQQVEAEHSGFDIGWAKKELYGEDLRDRTGLYAKYRKENPSQAVKAVEFYGSLPARGRW